MNALELLKKLRQNPVLADALNRSCGEHEQIADEQDNDSEDTTLIYTDIAIGDHITATSCDKPQYCIESVVDNKEDFTEKEVRMIFMSGTGRSCVMWQHKTKDAADDWHLVGHENEVFVMEFTV